VPGECTEPVLTDVGQRDPAAFGDIRARAFGR